MMFLKKYEKARSEKGVLCIGLDPPADMFGSPGNILDFCIKTIEKTADYACAVKPNSQYVLFAMDFGQLAELNKTAHENGLLSILDHKLSDIGPSNENAIKLMGRAGFDAFTFCPFAGNLKETTQMAHKEGLGIFCLTLMSNPEAVVLKTADAGGAPMYERIALDAHKYKTDGLVVGTTGHVTRDDITKIRSIAGDDKIFLCPGIGAQGGDIEKLKSAGRNILVNVGRSIILDKDPKKAAEKFHGLLKVLN